MKTAFQIAEEYIQLRKVCNPTSWVDLMSRINEMILTPLITLFYIFMDTADIWSVIPAFMSTYKAWSEWIQFNTLRFEMQQMYLKTMKSGGPCIVTNDSNYLPYVYADAVTRVEEQLHC